MADVDHELGSIRFIVDAPLSSKVAMFNNRVNQHKQSQFLNPFSQEDGRKSPRPSIAKDEYGKPIAGSLTEMRGHKANMHVWKEIYDLCKIIDDEGTPNPENPELKAILFGEIFNIYTHISDKCVGLLLRARKHGLLDFEGEMLFQRRDDDVPIYMLKTCNEIREIIKEKEGQLSRSSISPRFRYNNC
ncbi:unnamed protein product [Hermetia illucens]|uniref:Costars domain-containing protein n=1 Tax=Hermetia illucens TaxID=343691 RepID=A0A7R8UUR8_HERIL|nr:unnamed protein product [Hermetia illucens]